MTGNEEKMREVLRAEAATVLPSADAWSRITEGVAQQRRRRHWMQYGGLAAAASAAAVVTVVVLGGDGRTPEPGPTVPATQPAPTATSGPRPSATTAPSPDPTPAETEPAQPMPTWPESFLAVVQRNDVMRLDRFDAANGEHLGVSWTPGEFSINDVDVSADRKWIYVVRSLGDACQATIVRSPMAAGSAEDVVDETGPDGAEVFSLALSGDGKRMAYLRNPQCDGGGETSGELVVRDVENGRELDRLTMADPSPHGFPRSLAWEPVEQRDAAVVFAGEGPRQVGLLDMGKAKDLGDVKVVTGHNASCNLDNVTFAGGLLYASENCEPTGKAWTSTIVTFDTSTGRLDSRGPSYRDRYVVSMDADPSGKTLIYALAEGKDGRTEERWVYRLDLGGKPVEILHSKTWAEHLGW